MVEDEVVEPSRGLEPQVSYCADLRRCLDRAEPPDEIDGSAGIELVQLVGGGAGQLDAPHVPASRRRALASFQDDLVVIGRHEREGTTRHDLAGSRPACAELLDRVPGLRTGVGPVHHAEEVRGGHGESKLDGAIVERADSDGVEVVVAPPEVVLRILQGEQHRNGDAGLVPVEVALDTEGDVVSRERRPVRPLEAFAEREHVAQAVVCDLPALGERRNDRGLGPALDEPIEQRHLRLDVREHVRAGRIDIARHAADTYAQRCTRRLCRRSLPQLERLLVGLVGLAETKSRVQREGQLEERERHGLRLASALEEREESAVVPDRLVQRPREAGSVPRAGEVPDRLPLVLGRQPVVREEPENLTVSSVVLALEPHGRRAVQVLAPVREKGAVGRLLDEGVLEAVLGLRPASRHPDEVEPLELVERMLDALAVGDSLEQREAEVAPQRRGRREDVVEPGLQPVDTREDHALHGRRDLDRDVVVEAPRAVLSDEGTDLDERAHELLEVEGVAFRRVEDASLEVVGKGLGTDDGVEQGPLGVARERFERDLRNQVWHLARSELSYVPGGVIALFALGDDEQDGCPLADREQPLDELHRRRVCPVEVLQQDDERAIPGERCQELLDDLERAVLQRFGRELREPCGDVRLGRDTEERAEVRIHLGLTCAEQLSERALERDAHAELRIVQRGPEPLAEEVPERPVRQRLAVRDAPSLEPQSVIAGAGIREEAALADPRLAHDDEDASATCHDAFDRLAHAGELEVAADERRLDADDATLLRRVRSRPEGAMRDDGLRLALELELGRLAPFEEGLGESVGRRVDEDRARLRGALEPRRGVHGVTESGVLHALAGAERADDNRPCRDADSYPEAVDPPATLDLARVGAQRVDDRERGEQRSLGVVLGCDRRSEEGEHAVACQVLHVAAEPLDLADDPRDRVGHDELHLGVVEALGQRGRADDVREQRGDRATLLADRRSRVEGLPHRAILSTIARRCARSG